jgi:branched-chain amino acid transport system permease protein
MSLTQTSRETPLAEPSLEVRRRDLRLPLGIIVAIAALSAPFLIGSYALHAIIIALIFLLPAHGLNLLVGYTGLLSLAQAAFFGIGAYTAGLLAVHYGTPFYVNLVAAGLMAGLIALPLGIPALRLRATSFVMCTLGFVIIGQAIAKNWISVTRGDMGLSSIPKPHFALGPASFTVSGTTGFYYLTLAVAVLATLAVWAIVRSPAGRNMIAIRENETLAESVGVPTWRYKLIVFMISAVFAGVGGSIYAHYLTVVSPLTFQMYYSTTMLIIVLGGGAGTISGVVFGSLLFVGLSEALRVAPELRMIAYGFCLLILVFWFKKGFAPLLNRFWSFVGGVK